MLSPAGFFSVAYAASFLTFVPVLLITDHVGVTQRHGLINVTPDDAALACAQERIGRVLGLCEQRVHKCKLTRGRAP